MIKETKSLSLAEASKFIEEEELNAFIKKFTKIKPEEASKLRGDVEKLENIKIKEEHITKIIDLLPEDNQDISKIFTDVSLEENEISQIIEIVKKYK